MCPRKRLAVVAFQTALGTLLDLVLLHAVQAYRDFTFPAFFSTHRIDEVQTDNTLIRKVQILIGRQVFCLETHILSHIIILHHLKIIYFWV